MERRNVFHFQFETEDEMEDWISKDFEFIQTYTPFVGVIYERHHDPIGKVYGVKVEYIREVPE